MRTIFTRQWSRTRAFAKKLWDSGDCWGQFLISVKGYFLRSSTSLSRKFRETCPSLRIIQTESVNVRNPNSHHRTVRQIHWVPQPFGFKLTSRFKLALPQYQTACPEDSLLVFFDVFSMGHPKSTKQWQSAKTSVSRAALKQSPGGKLNAKNSLASKSSNVYLCRGLPDTLDQV